MLRVFETKKNHKKKHVTQIQPNWINTFGDIRQIAVVATFASTNVTLRNLWPSWSEKKNQLETLKITTALFSQTLIAVLLSQLSL